MHYDYIIVIWPIWINVCYWLFEIKLISFIIGPIKAKDTLTWLFLNIRSNEKCLDEHAFCNCAELATSESEHSVQFLLKPFFAGWHNRQWSSL